MTHAFRAVLLSTVISLSLSPAIAQTADDEDSSAIIVTGERPANEARGGTKTDTPLVETPQSISVISRDDLDVRGVLNLNQALRYTAGITPDQRGATATRYDQFKLRGFDVPQFLDGLRSIGSSTGYAAPQVDVSRLDRIEVIKGPASVLYGQSSPGGLVALSSKLPGLAESYGSVELTGGTYDLYRVDADIGGALNADGSIRYRAYGTVNGASSQLEQTRNRRYSGSLALAFGAGTDTTLTLLGNYQHDPKGGAYGSLPVYGTLRRNSNGRLPRDRYDGDPNFETFRRNTAQLTYLFEHRFDADWAVRLNGRYQNLGSLYRSVYGYGIPDFVTQDNTDTRTFLRGTAYADESTEELTIDNQVVGRFATGPLTHDVLIGLDFQASNASEAAGFGAAPSLDYYAPVYGVPIAMPAITFNVRVRQSQTGVYAQDQISLGGLRLTASGRYDWYEGSQRDRNAGSTVTQSPGKFTGRIGGLYLFDFGLAPYASYSTSFQPQSGSVAIDPTVPGGGGARQPKPSEGKQVEAGLKFQPPGTNLILTAAAFRIKQSNVLIGLPGTNLSIEAALVKSRGFELEAKAPLFKGFNLTANYSRQRVRETATGAPPIGVARENGGLFALYTLPEGALAGFGIGGGARYVGKSYGGAILGEDVYLPTYTLFDATISYDLARVSPSFEGLRAQVSAQNITDKRHITSCYINFFQWCWYGERRTVQATIGYRW